MGVGVGLHGFVELWSPDVVAGWAVDPSQPGGKATVAFLIDDLPAVVVKAQGSREDVAILGYGSSHCGFRISLRNLPRRKTSQGQSASPPTVVLWPSRIRLPLVAGCEPNFPENEAASESKSSDLTISGSVLVDGPLKGDYSIAIVNRAFTQALIPFADTVACHFDDAEIAEDHLFRSMPDVAERFTPTPDSSAYDVHSLNSWPPDTGHMKARLNVLHCYAWEESEFPQRLVDQFNHGLDLICVTSNYTQTVLENSGVTVPMAVIGNGVDHVLDVAPQRLDRLATQRFRFLHVSSCFPRKGADLLLQAFAAEFRPDEPVELLIKTFHNPHNRIEHQLAALRAEHPVLPPIRVEMDHLTPAQLRWLYESSGCAVFPSRGEGFLLPAAEAMLLGVPVITSDHGGQRDFCTDATAWLVKTRLAPAESHMALANSLWAEPDIGGLRASMREVFAATKAQRSERCAAARQIVSARYRWRDVAQRFVAAVRQRQQHRASPKPCVPAHRLGLVSTWNQKCGIAVYSASLIEAAPSHFDLGVLAEDMPVHSNDEPFVQRVWQRSDRGVEYLCDAIARNDLRSILVQHHPGMMTWANLARVVERAQGAGTRAFVELHSTREGSQDLARIAPALEQCGAVFVHTGEDATRLGSFAPHTRIVVVPLGVSAPTGQNPPAIKPAGFHVGSFGFLMPHKGVAAHLEALHMLRRRIPGLRATLLHALHDDIKTITYGAECFELRERLGLSDIVEIETRFLSIPEIWSRLASCDVLAFPYKANGESASAAIRSLAGLGVPMICSPAKIFDDVRTICHVARGDTSLDLAAALYRIASDSAERNRLTRAQATYVEMHSWARVAGRIFTVIERTPSKPQLLPLGLVA